MWTTLEFVGVSLWTIGFVAGLYLAIKHDYSNNRSFWIAQVVALVVFSVLIFIAGINNRYWEQDWLFGFLIYPASFLVSAFSFSIGLGVSALIRPVKTSRTRALLLCGWGLQPVVVFLFLAVFNRIVLFPIFG